MNHEEGTGYSNSSKFSEYRLANNNSNFQNEVSIDDLSNMNRKMSQDPNFDALAFAKQVSLGQSELNARERPRHILD